MSSISNEDSDSLSDDAPHATEFVDEMVEFIQTLVDNGTAYANDSGVYLRVHLVEARALVAGDDHHLVRGRSLGVGLGLLGLPQLLRVPVALEDEPEPDTSSSLSRLSPLIESPELGSHLLHPGDAGVRSRLLGPVQELEDGKDGGAT